MGETLHIKNVTKRFGGLTAVDNLTLSVDKGEIKGLAGPNGSGKTTLFNLISGVYTPDAGEVFLGHQKISGLKPHEIHRRGLARSFQVPRIFGKLTTLDNVLVAARGNPGEGLMNALLMKPVWLKKEKELREKAEGILESLEIEHMAHRPANELSGGQMKLLEIGRALMAEPSLLLLDEPTAGIHPLLAGVIFDKIIDLRRQLGLTLLIIEHRIELLMNYVDTLCVMVDGRIFAQGEPESVMSNETIAKSYLGAA